jgi:hypothetical protein
MNPVRLVVNNATRTLQSILGGNFPGLYAPKHNHAADFGYPDEITFELAYDAYNRAPLGRAAVEKTVSKTWQDYPFLQEYQRDGTKDGDQGETKTEADIRKRFDALRVWQHLAECDRRGLVGAYSGLILRLGDDKQFRDPVDRVRGGLLGLIEVIPAWEGQLTVSEWDTDEKSEGYGQPKMFSYREGAVGQQKQPRNFEIHPDRVIIWSRDGTLNGRSALEPGYNALLDMEKVRGGSGEGFYKNAKSGLSLEIDKDAKLADMAQAAGVETTDLVDKIGDQVRDFNRGFDQHLLMQGIKATPIQVTLPSPEHHFAIGLQSFAATFLMPAKILIGSQTGERASTEDANEWATVNMARRKDTAIPGIMTFVQRLVRFAILPAGKDWHLDWTSLLDPSPNEMLERVERMAAVNDKMRASGETVFTGDEMRAETGREPLSDAERFRDEQDDDEEQDALDLPETEDEPAPAA